MGKRETGLITQHNPEVYYIGQSCNEQEYDIKRLQINILLIQGPIVSDNVFCHWLQLQSPCSYWDK